jgi:AcrR family transcriptional regulator
MNHQGSGGKMEKNSLLTQREYKFAHTRYKTLKVFLKYIKEEREEELTIDVICEEVGISRGTFFNYFPSKEHLFTYYGYDFCGKLWLALKEKKAQGVSVTQRLEYVFDYTAMEDEKYTNSFTKFVRHILRRKDKMLEELPFTRADLIHVFPEDYESILQDTKLSHQISEEGQLASRDFIHIPTVGEMLYLLIAEGVQEGVFTKTIAPEKMLMHLLNLYFAQPITGKFLGKNQNLKTFYAYLLPDILEQIEETQH